MKEPPDYTGHEPTLHKPMQLWAGQKNVIDKYMPCVINMLIINTSL